MTRPILNLLALAAITTATLSTAAFADRGDGMGRGMMMGGMMGGEGFDFAAVDADKDGKITEAELDAWRAARASAMDANGDGLLNADELAAARLAEMTARAKQMATEMVAALDSDNDGQLSAAELAARPMPAVAFGRIDADGDGAVTEAELSAAQDRMAEGRGHHRGHDGEGFGRFFGHGRGASE